MVFVLSTQAQTMEETTIDIAGYSVPIRKGGLYDRYRSNTPLWVIASEYPNIDPSWFKTLNKKKVDIGFESYSPNLYYSNSSITAIFTDDNENFNCSYQCRYISKRQVCV